MRNTQTINGFRVYYPAFDGPDGAGDPGTGDPGTGDPGTGNTGAGGTSGSGPKSFTQDELNRMLAEDRRKHQNVVTGLQAEIAALSKRSDLTAKDRQDLESRLTDLNSQLLTKEELAKQDRDKLMHKHTTAVQDLTAERDSWRTRYETNMVVTALSEAAIKHNAYNPNQVVTLLRENTRLVEVMDDGKPTGKHEVRISLDSKNDKGEPIQLSFTPVEAVKHMSEQDDYLNLFKSDSATGFGGQRNSSHKDVDLVALARDPKAYREAKAKGLI